MAYEIKKHRHAGVSDAEWSDLYCWVEYMVAGNMFKKERVAVEAKLQHNVGSMDERSFTLCCAEDIDDPYSNNYVWLEFTFGMDHEFTMESYDENSEECFGNFTTLSEAVAAFDAATARALSAIERPLEAKAAGVPDALSEGWL